MKKIIIVLMAFVAIISMSNTINAQNSGWWAGGKVGYWHDKTNGVTSNNISLAPEVGYDFNSEWSFAGTVGFDYQKVGNENKNVFIVEPYARYKYFNKKAVTLFVDGGIGIAFGDTDGFKTGVTPGVAIKVSDHFSVLTTIGFFGYKKNYYNDGGEGFGFNMKSSDLKFGFFYSF